ncbi:REP-associated tyrosine transposase [Stenotrophomonas maltophilia]|jgi:REP element-mobilizing transposase RayT|uniref:REP-associated tyrosine transposase n=1 Tax=Stenotrophomonas TaxID=40323 RepID=UPI00201D1ADC|nr:MULTISPECIES: transposase [Stenotrophomonas]MBN5026060.1 transposase [Stenotrophomonas maltophilia]MDH1273141.1 transposase [Stenotrophomonas sp. GD03937]MDH1483820.1 transposase [Stenotrophomonas sp. GD03712]UQY97828.1 transposase [Stenotrophomonas maltophilia]WON69703.1 transposase [Stenotrophomonas maltophilia]
MQNTRLLIGRNSSVGLSYILTTVVTGRAPLFAIDAVAVLAIQEFQQLDREGFTHSIAHVVMPDHIHWLVELRAGTLETIMKRFKSRTALQANRLLGRVGRFWQACYHDHAIRSDESLHQHAMYLMGNPIRAGLTTRLGQYPHAWCEWELGALCERPDDVSTGG